MKRLLVPLMLLTLVFADTSASFSDVEVKPNPRDTNLRLEARKLFQSYASDYATTGKKPKPRPRLDCRVDAELPKYGCRTYQPADAPDAADLTEGDIVRAVREIGLPSLRVQIQPGTSTLVNVPTIFYTRPQPFDRSVTLLGFDVDLVAEPTRYRWVHGDGTTSTTSKPGQPYPSTEVTYRYRQPAEAVKPRVDVIYRVRYRVDGGAWQTIAQTLVASGPTSELEVREAAPVLTHP